MNNKRGQVTIFIIVAIIVVALAVLFYMISPRLGIDLTPAAKNPQEFIKTCIEEDIEESVERLSLQGGSVESGNYFLYENNKIEYLCYTNEYYKTCVVQQPLLKQHIESEIKNSIQDQVDACFSSLKDSYEKKGYGVDLKSGETKVELLPKRIISTFSYEVILTKAETEKYEQFSVILNNNLFELTSIANSIIEWETTYGDAETTVYMNYYHDLKVEKKKQQDGTTIYILTDRNTGNKFQFASRSVAWPSGFPEL